MVLEHVNQKRPALLWVRILKSFFLKFRILKIKLLQAFQGKQAHFGKNISFGANCNFRSAGDVFFENDVGIACQVIVETNLYIGSGTLVSSQVAFIGNDHSTIPGASSSYAPNMISTIKVGSNCWLGFRSIIIGPVNICSGVIIGAGAIVTRDIDIPGVYTGIPAKLIGRQS